MKVWGRKKAPSTSFVATAFQSHTSNHTMAITKRPRDDASTDRAARKHKKGFTVGPQNLPDGTHRRKSEYTRVAHLRLHLPTLTSLSHSHPNQAQSDRKGKTQEGIRKAITTSRRRHSTQATLNIHNHRRRCTSLAQKRDPARTSRHTTRASRSPSESTAEIKIKAQGKIALARTDSRPGTRRRNTHRRHDRIKSLRHPPQPPPKDHSIRKRTTFRPATKARSRRTPYRIRDFATGKS
jgi:hypothetical protein